LTVKDLFKPGITPDRVFTFMAWNTWGTADLVEKSSAKAQPLRLADAREFSVKLEQGRSVVDWSGLIRTKELVGIKPISFTMPADGYISLNLKNADGQVVRQLLNAAFFTKGPHVVKWDGLTNPSWKRPGEPLPAGDYSVSAITHAGIGLKLRGWAANGGSAPWDGATGTENWGGDHGLPTCCAADANHVYMAWNGAEAGKAVLACDPQGRVLWNNIRGGIAGAKGLAADSGVVYVLGGNAGTNADGGALYKLDAKDGSYLGWAEGEKPGSEKPDLILKDLAIQADADTTQADAVAARGGMLFLSFGKANCIAVVDAKTGKLSKKLTVESPGFLAATPGPLYVVSGGKSVLTVDPANGATKTIVNGLSNATGIAIGAEGRIFVGVRQPDNQILSFAADGKPASRIGRQGGRPAIGPWEAEGLAFIGGIAVDAAGKLWAAECDHAPKRISAWDIKSGRNVHEFFGPSGYGALGGAINPLDPNLMVGQGCEWRIDPETGRGRCLGVIHRGGMENARFGVGPKGKLYLAIATRWAFDIGPLDIYERVGDADYKLRTTIFYVDKQDKEIGDPAHGKTSDAAKTAVWSDENGDGARQPNEITYAEGIVRPSGWYLGMTPDLTFYLSSGVRYPVAGFTACGAPRYELGNPRKLPHPSFDPNGALGSVDGRSMLYGGPYGADHGEFACYDVDSGKLKWTYPNNFIGVHGSHNACPPEVGMVRGSFGPCGSAKLPTPLGNVWVIATNVGEWHLLTEEGFYLSKLFEGDPMKFKWPDQAVPGADLSRVPPGMGGEDFGGSISQGPDGKLYVQAGKTAFWNAEVTGLDRVQALAGSSVQLTGSDLVQAAALREKALQTAVGPRTLTAQKLTPKFSGALDADFKGAEIVTFQKQDDAAARAAMAWDDDKLYLGWEVRDATPWVNGAESPDQLYLSGDTVDFQLGVDTQADPNRGAAASGDLRLSIGNFKGQPTAVLYREVSSQKQPKVFSSGVVKEFRVDSVTVLPSVNIELKKEGNKYIVEAAIPLAALALSPKHGVALRGDLGVTHGDLAGKRTRLRTYWSNQQTGLVDDAVFELKLVPSNWGEMIFKN